MFLLLQQLVLTEATRYIQFLQMTIWKLGKKLNKNDEEMIKRKFTSACHEYTAH